MFRRKLIVFCIIVTGCVNPVYSQKNVGISLTEVLSIGGPDKEIIYQWAGVCTDDSGYIYITDMMDYSIKKFDMNGKLVKKTGRKGYGPGEFVQPINIYSFENKFYVLDLYHPGISVFDRNLKFIRFLRFQYAINDLYVVNSNKIMFNNNVLEKGLTVIDSLGNIISKINYYKNDDDDLLLSSSCDFEVDSKGNIFLAFLWQDKILKCNHNGERIWMKSLFGGKKAKKKKIKGFMLPTETCYKSIALDSRNNVFILGGDMAKNKSRDVYVFAANGVNLTTLTLDSPSHIIYIDKEDFLYTRADQSTCLKKYKINYYVINKR